MIPLTDDELRGLVREAIGRARSGSRPAASPPVPPQPSEAPVTLHVHASHALFVLGPSGDADGNCVIESSVRCSHCGYCQSYGH